ncbi:MAG: DUF559 domain-containing protein [Flavobacteriales bacterium]|nr:MAG: DUF559 domain-containing protein [Flavobacteriales bacterium]
MYARIADAGCKGRSVENRPRPGKDPLGARIPSASRLIGTKAVQSELLPLLDAAIRASFAAGEQILAVYGTDFTAEQKADKSPLTEADKRAHTVIAQELAVTALPLVSEEGKTMAPAERQAWQRYWLVDPLDGTKEFIKRNGEFTVNIALMDPIPGPSPVGKGEMHNRAEEGYRGDGRYTVADPKAYSRLRGFARDMRKEPTPAEEALWRMLRHDNLGVRFRRQHVIDEHITDFACLTKRLVIEVDGAAHLGLEEVDLNRTERLKTFGFEVLRFTNDEVLTGGQHVFETIKRVVETRPDHTADLPYAETPGPLQELGAEGSLPHRGRAGDGVTGHHWPIGGILYVPVKDTLYFAWHGGGAYRLQQARNFMGKPAYELAALAERLPVQNHRDTFTIVASRSHSTPETEAFIKEKEAAHGAVQLASIGSALKICLVAEGAADVYPRYAPTMEWDTAAGHAIALEAGRDITDLRTGTSMRYNKNELVNNWFIVQ